MSNSKIPLALLIIILLVGALVWVIQPSQPTDADRPSADAAPTEETPATAPGPAPEATLDEEIEGVLAFRNLKSPQAAIGKARTILNEHGDDSRAMLLLGELYLDAKQYQLALVQFRRIADSDGENADLAQIGLATALLRSGEIDEAALLADRVSASEHQPDVDLLRAEIQLARGSLEEAEYRYERAVKQGHRAFDALIALARMAIDRKDQAFAARRYAEAGEIEPDNTTWLWEDGKLARRQRDHLRASLRFARLVELGAEGGPLDARIGLAEARLYLGDRESAYSLLDEVLEADPNHFQAGLLRAEGAFADQNYAKANELLKVVFVLRPQNRRAILLRGASQLALGDLAAAEQSLSAFRKEDAKRTGRALLEMSRHLAKNPIERTERARLVNLFLRVARPIVTARVPLLRQGVNKSEPARTTNAPERSGFPTERKDKT